MPLFQHRPTSRVHLDSVLIKTHLFAGTFGPHPQPIAPGLNHDPINTQKLHAGQVESSSIQQRYKGPPRPKGTHQVKHIQPLLRNKT